MRVASNLKEEYKMILAAEKEINKMKATIEGLEELIKSRKDGIRNYYKLREEYKEEFPWHYPRNEFPDSRYRKEIYNYIFTEDVEKEFRESEWCHWYNPYGDGRDCTGVWFTTRIHIVRIPEEKKTIVVHYQSCDV